MAEHSVKTDFMNNLDGKKLYTGCPKNGVLTVHYGVEEPTVNVRKMFRKIYWT
jgi:hypothetical protein